MLTNLKIRNFKQFEEVNIDLSRTVVFVGPNNSGKTSALQALGLWDTGRRAWFAKRAGAKKPDKRPGVTINRRDLNSCPVSTTHLLWRDLHVRKGQKNIRIDIEVSGILNGQPWTCGFEFDFQNEESFSCRPLRPAGMEDKKVSEVSFPEIPECVADLQMSYLPPMGGLVPVEPRHDPGRIDVLIGEGQTSEILRNLCWGVFTTNPNEWSEVTNKMHNLFGIRLLLPDYVAARGEISLAYLDRNNVELDISCCGRGMHQTLLLLARLYANPGAILLLDEPDAHLEVLRQQEVFKLLSNTAEKRQGQIIAASHSEVVLNEAANAGTVVAFLGAPHILNDGKSSQLLKSLRELGWEQYYEAEQKKWVLYLEDSTDLSILQTFAEILDHPAQKYLARPFFRPVTTNLPQKARDHYYGLREAVPDLGGVAIFDRLDKELHGSGALRETMWKKREIENYFCTREVLNRFIRSPEFAGPGPLFSSSHQSTLDESIQEVENSLRTLDNVSPWDDDCKASDRFLEPLMRKLSEKMERPLTLRKNEFFKLARFILPEEIDPEVAENLDLIHEVASACEPEDLNGA